MKLQEAVKLIEFENDFSPGEQVWADLGCGSGTFTLALSNLLPDRSIIYAIDKKKSSLNKIPGQHENVSIIKQQGNFENTLPSNLDGILMANSLHYVKEQASFIKNAQNHLKNNGMFLIVEYDSNVSNPWVPYPINFKTLRTLFKELGFVEIRKLREHPSLYHQANIYSAIAIN
jgi:ubiquinone/menaquinone biosynthesis C-methylase UbiE